MVLPLQVSLVVGGEWFSHLRVAVVSQTLLCLEMPAEEWASSIKVSCLLEGNDYCVILLHVCTVG